MTKTIFFCILCLFSLEQIHANIKNESIKTIRLEVTIPSNTNSDSVQATIPALKYNKKIVTTWTVDDSYSVYNHIFCVVNKKWVDDELMSFWDANDNRTFFYHLNGEKTTGYIPQKALEYTDGCGISHRFAATVACWPWKLTEINKDVSKNNVWVSSKEMCMMQDFGFSFCYHDIKEDLPPTSQEEFDKALATAADSFKSKTERIPKIMIEPNGNHDYVTFSLNNDLIEATISQTIDRDVFPFIENESLDKKSGCIKRFFGKTSDELYNQLSTELTLKEKERKWIINGSHRQYHNNVSDFFSKIDSTFGTSGEDCIWVPSIDEYVEYSYMRNHTVINKSIVGNKVIFTIQVPVKENFWFQSISLLISGIKDTSNIEVSASDNVYGLSYGMNDKKLLTNLDFNNYLPLHAEKYTAIFEQEKTVEAYEDAIYFISLLKKEFQTPYRKRIDSLTTAPSIESFTINDGKEMTSNTLVSIALEASKSAVYYRLSESCYFEDSSWKLLEPTTVFKLSPEPGTKKIYLQLKNALYLSDTISAQIKLLEQKFKLVVGFSGNSRENVTEFINEEILNKVALGFKETYTALKLYDVCGNQVMKLAKNKSDICNALQKYGICEGGCKTASSLNPLFSGNLGDYPDLYYSVAYCFGPDSAVKYENRRLIAGFINVPNGLYDVRILASQSKETKASDYQTYRYQVNNSDIYIPDSDIFLNNRNKYIEFRNVKIEDSVLLVCSWRDPYGVKWGSYAPMNLIEISEAGTIDQLPNIGGESSLHIYSSEREIIVEKSDFLPFTIYSIDGMNIKYIIPKSARTKIKLPSGIYIIMGKKAIVF